MAQFHLTEWELTNKQIVEPDLEDGDHAVKITDASWDSERGIYRIKATDIFTGVEVELPYWMYDRGTKNLNKTSDGTIRSLCKAMFGINGMPAPCDILGGVVIAEVKHREYNGQRKIAVYHYHTATSDLAPYSDKINRQTGEPEQLFE